MARLFGVRYPRPVNAASAVAATVDLSTAPTTATKYDDEFTTAVLKNIWTLVASPGAGFEVYYNADGTYLKLNSPGAASNNHLLLRQPIDNADGDAGVALTVLFKLDLTSYTGTSTTYTIVQLGNSSTESGSNYVHMGIIETGGSYTVTATETGSSKYSQDWGRGIGEIWFLYQRTAANVVRLYASINGRTWRRLYSGSMSWNVDYIFIDMQGHSASGNASTHLMDFIRINDSRATQFIA